MLTDISSIMMEDKPFQNISYVEEFVNSKYLCAEAKFWATTLTTLATAWQIPSTTDIPMTERKLEISMQKSNGICIS